MSGTTETKNLAVLGDADNVSSKAIAGLMAEVATYGIASVRRVYGDWTSPHMNSWQKCLLEHSLSPMQQFAYTTGKNATDGAMIIDAMDLLYTGRFVGFCIVSSDSDFTKLAVRIREQGVPVYGFGERKTPNALVVACSKFTYFDALSTHQEETEEEEAKDTSCAADAPTTDSDLALRPAASSPPSMLLVPTSPRALRQTSKGLPPHLRRPIDQAALSGLSAAISASSTYEDDWVYLADVGDKLPRLSPDLLPRNYGYERLRDFVEASGIVDLRMKPMDGHAPVALVRLKLS